MCCDLGFDLMRMKMIAIARTFMNPNSCIYTSILHFSTSRLKVNPSPAIYDLLAHKHHFSPKLASLAAIHFNRVRSPKRADSVISFLKENSFTSDQMERIVLCNPRILGLDIKDLKLKLKLFHDLGLSSVETAKLVSNNVSILHSSTPNSIVPSLSVLHGLLGSDREVARLLRRCGWFLTSDLEKTLVPNVEILKSSGLSMERIVHFLFTYPRYFLVKPDMMMRSLDKIVEIGVPHSSKVFLRASCVFAYVSEGMWEAKLQILRDSGFSDSDAYTMFMKAPMVFLTSGKKMKKVIELVLATGKYSVSNIVKCPPAIGASIEKRLEPRMQILQVLESRDLIPKWPGLSMLTSVTDDRFFDRYVRPYCDEIGEEFITKIHGQGKTK